MLRPRSAIAAFVLFLLPLAASCSSPAQPGNKSADQSLGEPIPAGPLMAEQIRFQFAIYYLPTPTNDPKAELAAILSARPGSFVQVDKIEGNEQDPTLSCSTETDPQTNYAPPDMESLQYFGRGLTREQSQALQSTQQAAILNFSYDKQHVWTGMRSALEITHALALATGGVLWDEATREIFSPDEWHARRIEPWKEEIPNISKQTVIHAYQDNELARAITLGMEKFGLPDVVVNHFSWSLNKNVGITINLFTQAIAEGAEVVKPGEFDLDIKSIKNATVRDPQVESLLANATGVALLALHEGTSEKGDPANRLVEISFERGTGPDMHSRQEQVLAAAFGWEDEVSRVEHDDQLEHASQLARTRLPALRAEFQEGLAPGEFILVKAPFDTPTGGREWMWVEITTWQGDRISGLLKNEPRDIPTLHGGQIGGLGGESLRLHPPARGRHQRRE